MKEATGEFSMTVVTILAIIVIAGLVGFLSPRIAGYIQGTWSDVTTTDDRCPEGQYWDGNTCEPVVAP